MSKAIRNVFFLNNNKSTKISVIILAAGLPNRMTSHTSKLLINTDGTTLFDKYAATIKKHISNFEIIIVGGYAANDLYYQLPNDIIFVENKDFATSNNGISLKLGLMAATTNNILVLYDNLIFDDKILSGIQFNESFVVSETKTLGKKHIGLIHNEAGLDHISYDMPEKWANIVYFTGKEYELLREQCRTVNEKTIVFEMINQCVNKHGKFTVYTKNKQIRNINSNKDI